MNKNKIKMLAMLAIFITPMFISWLLYSHHEVLPLKTLNNGTLVQPVMAAQDITGNKTHTWQIMYLPGQCNDDAADHEMFMLHQLRRVLGKNGERVSLVVAGKKNCTFGDTHDFQRLQLTPSQLANLQKKLRLNKVENKIYLLDPRGNLFMYYADNTDTMNVLKDLQRVLEVSQIG